LDNNPHVSKGLSWEGIKWAFSTGHTGYPHPLTWLSLMLDTTIFGPEPQGHRVVNVLIHVLNACLVFLLCRRLLPNAWIIPSVVAVTFAWHPTRLESVVWISERKDVLSTLFMLLTIGGYLSYSGRRTVARYLSLVVLPFLLALLSKPSAVILPPLLMLMDLWPLGCISVARGRPWHVRIMSLAAGVIRNLPDKILLFVLAGICGWLAWSVAEAGEINASLEAFSMEKRIKNLPVTYGLYLYRLFVPENLVILRLHPLGIPPYGMILVGGSVLLGCTALGLLYAATRPYLLVSWLWFLGILFPVSGLFQNGMQLVAYRYTYLSYVGLTLFVCLGLRDLGLASKLYGIKTGTGYALAWGCLLFAMSSFELPVWRSDFSMWERAAMVNRRHYVAYTNLASAANYYGFLKEAEAKARVAMSITPDATVAQAVLARTLSQVGRFEEAEQVFSRIRNLRDDAPAMLVQRAVNLAALNRIREAEALLRNLVQSAKAPPVARLYHALALRELGKLEESDQQFQLMLEEHPQDALLLSQRAATLTLISEIGDKDFTLSQRLAEEAFKLDPGIISGAALSYVLARSGRVVEAGQVLAKLRAAFRSSHDVAALDVLTREIEAGSPKVPEILKISPKLREH
jgi:tetratricopeptide (TPR) repeat protein